MKPFFGAAVRERQLRVRLETFDRSDGIAEKRLKAKVYLTQNLNTYVLSGT
jgi:hypothetical protein